MQPDRPCLLIAGPAAVEAIRRRRGEPAFAPLADSIVAAADEWLAQPPLTLPPVPEPITLDTPRTGEIHVARQLQSRLITLGFAFVLTGQRGYAERAVAEMRFAVEQWDRWVDWAHRPGLCELMTGTIATGFAFALDWLVPAIARADREAIVAGVRRRAFETFLHEIGRGVWWSVPRERSHGSPVNNWNAWINGGLGLLALATLEEEPLSRRVLEAARASIAHYVDHLPDDGGNEEGAGYWAVGMRYAVLLHEALRTALGDDGGFFDRPAVRNSPQFAMWLSPGGTPMGFGDAVSTGADPAVFNILAGRLDRPDLAWFPRAHGGEPIANAVFRLIGGHRDAAPEFSRWPTARHWPSVGWAFFASGWPEPEVYLSFKNGDLRASHSQLDLNSFQLYAFGEKLLVDLGAPHYTRKYFSPQRWEIYPAQTRSHNAVLIDDADQAPNSAGRIEQFHPGDASQPAGLVGLVDDSYGPHVRRVRRHVVMLAGRLVLLLDEVAADRPVRLAARLHTFGRFERRDDQTAVARGERANVAIRWAGEDVDADVLDNPHQWRQPEQVLHLSGRGPQSQWLLATLLAPSPGREPAAVELSLERVADGVSVTAALAGEQWKVDFESTPQGLRRVVR